MEAKVSTKITINASPHEVFDYVTDLKHHYLWNPQIHAISTTKNWRWAQVTRLKVVYLA